MLKQTSIVEDWLKESFTKGKLEGQRQGRLSLVHKILKQKFGRIPAELQNRLQKLDDEDLERFSLALLNINTLKDLNMRLRNGASASHNS